MQNPRMLYLLGSFLPSPAKIAFGRFLSNRSISTYAGGCNSLAKLNAQRMGMSAVEFDPNRGDSVAGTFLTRLTGNSWRPGTFLQGSALSSSNLTVDNFLAAAQGLRTAGGGRGSYLINTASSVKDYGHMYIYFGQDRALTSDAISALQKIGSNNTLRCMVGAIPVGSQALTPDQISLAKSSYQAWSNSSPDGTYDIFPNTDPIASQQAQIANWNNNAEINGTVYLLGRSSIVQASNSFNFSSNQDGKIVNGLQLTTLPDLHVLDGFAFHSIVTDPINMTYTNVLVGGGRSPLTIIDPINQVLALNLWLGREALLTALLNNFNDILQSSGSQNAITFDGNTLELLMRYVSQNEANVIRSSQMLDTFSPVVMRMKTLARWIECLNSPSPSDSDENAEKFIDSDELNGEGNPPYTDDPQNFENQFKD